MDLETQSDAISFKLPRGKAMQQDKLILNMLKKSKGPITKIFLKKNKVGTCHTKCQQLF